MTYFDKGVLVTVLIPSVPNYMVCHRHTVTCDWYSNLFTGS